MDIRFYDFSFNLLYILPSYSDESGYISVNAREDFSGSGAFELEFYDPRLKRIIEENRDRLIVSFNGFWGFLTSYRWDEKMTVYGMHLNGLLHRAVLPKTDGEVTGGLSEIITGLIENIDWLKVKEPLEECGSVTYSRDDYSLADEYIEELLGILGVGYRIDADIKEKCFTFSLIVPSQRELIISSENKNAHDFQVSYINKKKANGGWYKDKESGEWRYISLSEKAGIEKIDTLLSKTNENDAINELKNCTETFEILAEIYGLEYRRDYKIGDIVRVQNEELSVKKQILGVRMWDENGYAEEPILGEISGGEDG